MNKEHWEPYEYSKGINHVLYNYVNHTMKCTRCKVVRTKDEKLKAEDIEAVNNRVNFFKKHCNCI